MTQGFPESYPPSSHPKQQEDSVMYVVIGASGNTGHVVAQELLEAGKQVRAVSRNPTHLQFLAAKGAEVFTADVTDASALTKAFSHAEAAYVMIPPDTKSNDVRASQEALINASFKAVRDSGIKNIVALSSVGADLPAGTGPVTGLHNLEQKLNQLDGVNVLYLRAGYFMENTLPQAAAIRGMGATVGPLRADLKLPMISTCDIGKAAAKALIQLDFTGKQVRELHGQRDLDYNEVTAIIGKAIARPELKYIHAPDDQVRAAMMQMGLSGDFVGLILEMAGALNSGKMRFRENRSSANTTATTFEDFVNESFVPAYQQQAAA